MKITVIGCGRWGSFLAWYAARLGHDTVLYGREGSVHMEQLECSRQNSLLALPEEVRLSTSLALSAVHGELLILSVGAQSLRGLMQELAKQNLRGKTLVLCMKGLEKGTGLRLTQVVASFAPHTPTVIWVGPGHVQDFLAGVPNCMVVDSEFPGAKELVVQAMGGDLIRFYYGDDLIGNEVGAAAKNVVGLAAGMLDGLEKAALKGALMSRGTREIARLIGALGGREMTAYGLSHLGDYQATVFSQFSHNRLFGERFVRGERYGELAEGVPTTTALLQLSAGCGVELPICAAVNEVLHEGREPGEVLSNLFLRSLKMEF